MKTQNLTNGSGLQTTVSIRSCITIRRSLQNPQQKRTYLRASEILTGRIIKVMTDLGLFEPYEEGKKRNRTYMFNK